MLADAGEVIKQRRTCRRRDPRGPGEARRPRCPRGARHTAGPSSTPDSVRRRPWFSPPLCNLSPCRCSTPSPVLQKPPPIVTNPSEEQLTGLLPSLWNQAGTSLYQNIFPFAPTTKPTTALAARSCPHLPSSTPQTRQRRPSTHQRYSRARCSHVCSNTPPGRWTRSADTCHHSDTGLSGTLETHGQHRCQSQIQD